MNLRFAVVLALFVPAALLARQQTVPAPRVQPSQQQGFRAEFIADLDEVQQKVLDLAAAFPADKYAWRPAPDVRSVSEVFMHVAGGNYFLASFAGAPPPADLPADLEKITEKSAVRAELQRSFAHVRTLVKNTPDSDLDKQVMMYGKPTTVRAVLTTILNHLHEHLGQSVAYARMNKVVPPWSK